MQSGEQESEPLSSARVPAAAVASAQPLILVEIYARKFSPSLPCVVLESEVTTPTEDAAHICLSRVGFFDMELWN